MLAVKVTDVEREGAQFAVLTDDHQALQATTLLFATGVVDELPNIDGIDELFGRSVHVCPYCDGWEHRNAPVAVYGQGEKAVRFSILLRQWTDDLVLCTDGSQLAAEHSRLLYKAGINVREHAIARVGRKKTKTVTQRWERHLI
jgi:thioredoxin reductase